MYSDIIFYCFQKNIILPAPISDVSFLKAWSVYYSYSMQQIFRVYHVTDTILSGVDRIENKTGKCLCPVEFIFYWHQRY